MPPGYGMVDDDPPPSEKVSAKGGQVEPEEVWGGSNWASTAVLKASLPTPCRKRSPRLADSPPSERCNTKGHAMEQEEVWGGSNWASSAALHAALPTPCRKRSDGRVSRMTSQGESMCTTPLVPRTAAGARDCKDRMSPPSRQAPSTAKAEKKRSLYSAPPAAGPREVDLLDVLATPPVCRSRGCGQRQPTVIEADLCCAAHAQDGGSSPAVPRNPCPPRELFSVAASPVPGRLSVQSKIEAGSTVCIHGLQVAVDYNGMCGTVDAWDEAHGLWMVRLRTGEQKSLSADNLQIVDRFGAVDVRAPERQYSRVDRVSAVPTAVDRVTAVPTPVMTSPARMLSVNPPLPPSQGSQSVQFPPPYVSLNSTNGAQSVQVPGLGQVASQSAVAMPRSPLVVSRQPVPSHSGPRATIPRHSPVAARALSAGPPAARASRPHVLPRPCAGEPKSVASTARTRVTHGSPRALGASNPHSSTLRHGDGRRSPAHSPTPSFQGHLPSGARSPSLNSYRPPVPPQVRQVVDPGLLGASQSFAIPVSRHAGTSSPGVPPPECLATSCRALPFPA